MNSNQYIVGIDPDTEKNGYAIIDMETKKVSVTTVTLPHLMEIIDNAQAKADEEGKRLTVYVEAGWLCQSNWHLHFKDSKQSASAKGRSLGRNHQRGMDIIELLKYRGIKVEAVKPLEKKWKGADRKITHEELVNIVGEIEHTNQEGRDAALLAWHYKDTPMELLST